MRAVDAVYRYCAGFALQIDVIAEDAYSKLSSQSIETGQVLANTSMLWRMTLNENCLLVRSVIQCVHIFFFYGAGRPPRCLDFNFVSDIKCAKP